MSFDSVAFSSFCQDWHLAALELPASLWSERPQGVTSLVLLFGVGDGLYRRLKPQFPSGPDPLDRACVEGLLPALQSLGVQGQVLYPGPLLLPYQSWWQGAGFAQASPLGLSLHPRFGLWFALRLALALEQPLGLRQPEAQPWPCALCPDQPCQSACPARAVPSWDLQERENSAYPAGDLPPWRLQEGKKQGEERKDAHQGSLPPFDLAACSQKRQEANSPCALACPARQACPAGADFVYGDQAMAFHARHSLQELLAWSKPGRKGH